MEPEVKTNQSEPAPETKQETQPVISEDKLRAIVDEAIAKTKPTQPEGKPLTEADIGRIVAANRQAIADSISGKKEQPKVNPLLQGMVNEPDEFFTRLIAIAKEETKKELMAERAESTKFQKAYVDVLGDRPDIINVQEAQDIILNFYQKTSENESEANRLKEALRQYDVFLERQNAGDAKERINRARGVSLNTSTSSDAKPATKSMAEILEDEQREQKEAYLRSRGRFRE